MANTNDPTVKIELRTDYDNTGARAAADDLQDLSQSAASAMQGSGASAEAEALRSKALVEMAKLEAKTRRELEAEIKRLIAARKEAAAAGDTKRFAALTDQLGRVKKAYADMRNAANLNKAALMGQANAGMQFAGTLSSLSAQLESGRVNLADMATGVMSLGMALKAGLGPIGWAMTAIQGLSMAIEYLSTKEEMSAEKATAAANARAEGAQKIAEAYRQVYDVIDAAQEREFDMQEERAERMQKEEARKLRSETYAAAIRREAEMKDANADMQVLESKARKEVALGKKTADAVTKERRASEDCQRKITRDNAIAEAQERKKAARKENEDAFMEKQRLYKLADDKAREYGEAWEKADNRLLLEMVGAADRAQAEMEVGRAKLNELKRQRETATGEDKDKIKEQIKQTREDIKKRGSELNGAMLVIARELNMEAKDAPEAYARFKQASKEYADIQKRLNRTSEKMAEAHEKEGKAVNDANKAKDDYERDRKIDEARRKAEDAENLRRTREEEWAKASTGDPREAVRLASSIRNTMMQGSEEWKKWRDRSRQMHAAIRTEEWEAVQKKSLEAQKEWLKKKISELSASEDYKERRGYQKQLDSTEAQLRAKGYHEAQSRTLAEQLSYVQRMLEATKEGTLEWEKWRDEQKKLNNLKVHEELEKLEKRWQVSQNYAEACSKTAAETLAADRKALFERQRRLQALLRTPDIDAKTTREINERLKETNRSISGFAASMRQGAVQAARDLQNARLPDLRAENKQFTGNLKQVQKAYIAALRRATQHAAKGDSKGLKRDMASIERLTKTMEAIGGYNGQAMERMQGDLGKLATVYYGFGKQGGKKMSLTESIKDEVLNGSKRRAKAARAQEMKDAEEDEQRDEQRDAKRERRKPAKATKPKQVTPPAENGKELAEPLQRAASEVKDMAAAGRAMKEAVVQGADRLVQAVQGVAQEMQGVAGAVDSKFASVLSSVNDLRTQINNLKNDISR